MTMCFVPSGKKINADAIKNEFHPFLSFTQINKAEVSAKDKRKRI